MHNQAMFLLKNQPKPFDRDNKIDRDVNNNTPFKGENNEKN